MHIVYHIKLKDARVKFFDAVGVCGQNAEFSGVNNERSEVFCNILKEK